MNLWSIIKGLSLREIGLLTFLMFRQPLLIWPTLSTTKRTVLICNQLYGDIHNGQSKENAFRHALWNILYQFYFKIAQIKKQSFFV
ncbi:hypothetical protein [Aquimarina sp. U1-2]|uniref:DUF6973 domain-containing protein n=1 Tax=Aquimarina sp. U1-2 TaxID=2823141 RepID=UPI0035304B51